MRGWHHEPSGTAVPLEADRAAKAMAADGAEEVATIGAVRVCKVQEIADEVATSDRLNARGGEGTRVAMAKVGAVCSLDGNGSLIFLFLPVLPIPHGQPDAKGKVTCVGTSPVGLDGSRSTSAPDEGAAPARLDRSGCGMRCGNHAEQAEGGEEAKDSIP